MNRRRFLSLIIGAGAVGALFAPRWLHSLRPDRQIKSVATAAFGEDIARSPACRAFLADYAKTHQSGSPPLAESLTLAFLQASNVVHHAETGIALEYTGIYDPYLTPCANQLTANYST